MEKENKIKCKIIKMYINNKKMYYLVNIEDLKQFKQTGFLPYVLCMKYKKYLLEHFKNNKEKYSNIEIVKE